MTDNLNLPELLIDGIKIDGRTAIARLYRDQLHSLNKLLGNNPSIAESMMMRRCSTLAVLCSRDELKILNGEPIDEPNYRANTSVLRQLLQTLGTLKQTRDIKKEDYKTYDAHTAAVLDS